MLEKINDHNVVAEDDIWEAMDGIEPFNNFIGQCVTHFAHFVIPRRDQTQEISEIYDIPKGIDGVLSSTVELTRKDSENTIYISYYDW